MKPKTILFTFVIVISMNTDAQDYLISFSGSGASATITSVLVDNITQGTSLTIDGTNVLHLVGTITGIETKEYLHNSKVTIYPNPMTDLAKLEFETEYPETSIIRILDLSGKIINQTRYNLIAGIHSILIYGLDRGCYIVSIRMCEKIHSCMLVSMGSTDGKAKIEHLNSISTIDEIRTDGSIELKNETDFTKGTYSDILMQYNTGDRIKFTGISGNYKTVVTDIPVQNKTINFNFASCVDPDNKNYTTVTLGSQIWMAENLAYLPAVSPSTISSNIEKYYYVYNYQGVDINEAKATSFFSTYGVLYNWPAAMNGHASSSANPSGVRGVCPDGWHLPSKLYA